MNLFLLQGPGYDRYFREMPRFTYFLLWWVVFLILLNPFIPAFALASSAQSNTWSEWQTAKDLYDSQKYGEAIQALLAHPKEDASYYYNLGTAYYREGKIGVSLAHLEKANHLSPHDPDIQYNLSIARSKLSTKIGEDHLDPASTWAEQISDRVSLDEVRATLGFLGLIVAILWTRAYLKTRDLRKALFNSAGLIGLTGFAISCGIYGIQRWAEANPPAICLEPQKVRSGPGDQYLELSEVQAGTKLRLLGPTATSSLPSVQSTPGPMLGDSTQLDHSKPGDSIPPEVWRQVRYSSDGIGWVRSSSLLAL